jgi:hypothetical protein
MRGKATSMRYCFRLLKRSDLVCKSQAISIKEIMSYISNTLKKTGFIYINLEVSANSETLFLDHEMIICAKKDKIYITDGYPPKMRKIQDLQMLENFLTKKDVNSWSKLCNRKDDGMKSILEVF